MGNRDLYMRRGQAIVIVSNISNEIRQEVKEMFLATLDQLDDMLTVPASVLHQELKKEFPLAGTPAGALRSYRIREDLTQAELAKKSGIAQGHISAMERGKRAIGSKSARILAKVLNCRFERLLSEV